MRKDSAWRLRSRCNRFTKSKLPPPSHRSEHKPLLLVGEPGDLVVELDVSGLSKIVSGTSFSCWVGTRPSAEVGLGRGPVAAGLPISN